MGSSLVLFCCLFGLMASVPRAHKSYLEVGCGHMADGVSEVLYVVEGSSPSPLLDGLAEELLKSFPSMPPVAVDKALADGLRTAAEDESMDIADVSCARDYSAACPEGTKCRY
jgi:hypothetical protein